MVNRSRGWIGTRLWGWVSVVVVAFVPRSGLAQKQAERFEPVPPLQVVPLPYAQASFQWDGVELTRYHFGRSLRRPFLFPVNGPSGRCLTRMGHPHDPESHSHHNSVWISHHDVGGVDFWSDHGGGTIRHKRIVRYEDLGRRSVLVAENEWVGPGSKVLLEEQRRIEVLLLDGQEWLMVIELELRALEKSVVLGKSPFGLIGIRMAKTIGVRDGGGRIRNSEGAVNEKQIFWKRARWVDYSGAVKEGVVEGITLMDHPQNANFPTHFHVRDDGWMGASLTLTEPRTIESGRPLRVRYGLYVHSEMKSRQTIEELWKRFVKLQAPAGPRKAGRK